MNVSRALILVSALALVLAGCGNRSEREIVLTQIKHKGSGPDEFSVLPTKPLVAPENFSALPAPTPGGSNLTDPNPQAEGIAALGGNPNAVINTGIGKADGSLLNHSRRYGVSDGIRQTLATEDIQVRRRHGRVNILRIGYTDDYTNAYKKMWLDSHAEHKRLRRRGIITPSAPPPS